MTPRLKKALYLLTRNAQLETAYEVRKDEIVIGRAPSCDVPLPALYVSREHAKLVRKGEVVELWRSADAPARLAVDGHEVGDKPVSLAVGCTIEIGDITIKLVDALPIADRTSVMLRDQPGAPDSTVPMASVVVKLLDHDAMAQRFQILSELTRGPNGVIYLARQKLTQRVVVLKTMSPDAEDPGTAAQRFVLEGILTARFNHPNILPVYDVGFVDSQELYYTAPFIEAVDLRDSFEKCREPAHLERALGALAQIAAALAYVHEMGFLHLDVKPSNILVNKRGHAYLADFGITCPIPGRPLGISIPTVSCAPRTKGGTPETGNVFVADDLLERTMLFVQKETPEVVAGTFRYMAPEQAMAKPSVESEIWAMGVLISYATTGVHPYDVYDFKKDPTPEDYRRLSELPLGPSVEKVLREQKRAEPIPGLIDLCNRALRRGRPFSTMAELETALRAVLDRARARLVEPHRAPAPPPRSDEATQVIAAPPPAKAQPAPKVAPAPRVAPAPPNVASAAPSPMAAAAPDSPRPMPSAAPRGHRDAGWFPVVTPAEAAAARAAAASVAAARVAAMPPPKAPISPGLAEPVFPSGSGAIVMPPSAVVRDVPRIVAELACLPWWAMVRRTRLRRELRTALALEIAINTVIRR